MKKLLLMLIVLLLVAANAQAGSLQDRLSNFLGFEPEPGPGPAAAVAEARAASNFTVWALGQPTGIDNSGSEFSGRVGWETDEVEVGIQVDRIDHRESVGMYFIMLLEGDISTALGRAYTGFVLNDAGNGPIAGTVVDGFIVAEYRYLDGAKDRHTLYAGLRFLY